jgi:hypothetical protein
MDLKFHIMNVKYSKWSLPVKLLLITGCMPTCLELEKNGQIYW